MVGWFGLEKIVKCYSHCRLRELARKKRDSYTDHEATASTRPRAGQSDTRSVLNLYSASIPSIPGVSILLRRGKEERGEKRERERLLRDEDDAQIQRLRRRVSCIITSRNDGVITCTHVLLIDDVENEKRNGRRKRRRRRRNSIGGCSAEPS